MGLCFVLGEEDDTTISKFLPPVQLMFLAVNNSKLYIYMYIYIKL